MVLYISLSASTILWLQRWLRVGCHASHKITGFPRLGLACSAAILAAASCGASEAPAVSEHRRNRRDSRRDSCPG